MYDHAEPLSRGARFLVSVDRLIDGVVFLVFDHIFDAHRPFPVETRKSGRLGREEKLNNRKPS